MIYLLDTRCHVGMVGESAYGLTIYENPLKPMVAKAESSRRAPSLDGAYNVHFEPAPPKGMVIGGFSSSESQDYQDVGQLGF